MSAVIRVDEIGAITSTLMPWPSSSIARTGSDRPGRLGGPVVRLAEVAHQPDTLEVLMMRPPLFLAHQAQAGWVTRYVPRRWTF